MTPFYKVPLAKTLSSMMFTINETCGVFFKTSVTTSLVFETDDH